MRKHWQDTGWMQAALLADDQWIKEECARRAESQRKSEVKQRINI